MKPRILTLTSLLAFLSIPAFAQESNEAAKAEKPAADPFLKEEKKEVIAPTSNDEPQSFTNVGALVQWIDVKKETWEAWLEKNPVPLDAGPLREQAETWIAEGEAELAETTLVMGRSGQRALVQSARKVYYPTEFDPGKGPQSYPVSFDCREEGTMLEIDPTLNKAGAVDLNLAPTRVLYRGENPPRETGAGIEPGDIRWPDFQLLKATLQLELDTDQWALLGSEQPVDERESQRTLIFVRPVVHQFEAAAPDNPGEEGTMKLEWVEIDHATLNRELLSPAKLGKRIGGGIRQWARDNDSKLLETRTLRFRSGQRVKNESVEELIHPTEFDQMEAGTLSRPASNETIHIGITIETDPILEAGGGAVQANLAAEWITRHGTTTHHRVQINGEWVPDVTFPRLHEMESITQVAVPMDVPTLVSIMSPPGEEGATDTSRKVLLFLTVSR